MGVVTPEGKVKIYVRKFMQTHFPGHFYYSPMGGAFGKSGMPDHLYLWKGILIGIEVKADKGRLSELQRQTLDLMSKQGAICAVVYGKDDEKMMLIKSAIEAEVKRRENTNVTATTV